MPFPPERHKVMVFSSAMHHCCIMGGPHVGWRDGSSWVLDNGWRFTDSQTDGSNAIDQWWEIPDAIQVDEAAQDDGRRGE